MRAARVWAGRNETRARRQAAAVIPWTVKRRLGERECGHSAWAAFVVQLLRIRRFLAEQSASRFALQNVDGAFFGADGEVAVVGGPGEFRRGGGHLDGGAEGFGAFGAPELHGAVGAGGGEEAVGVLKRKGADRSFVREHGGLAALGAFAAAIPDAGFATPARGEPARGVVVGEMFHLGLVAAHVELDVFFRNPEVDGGVLVSGYEPALVRGPDEGVNAVGVGKFFLEEKVVGVPELYAAEVGGGDASSLVGSGEGGDGFGGGLEAVGDGGVGAEGGEVAAGRGGEERRRAES